MRGSIAEVTGAPGSVHIGDESDGFEKIVLATFGTLGDIYPFIAIALALKARGFAPLIAAPPMYQRAIEAEGIAHARLRPDMADVAAALGTDIPGAFKLMLRNPHFILDEIYMRFLAETYEDVIQACGGARLLVAHSLLVGAHQAAEKLGLPSARVALAPLHLQSAAAPSLTPSAPYILEPKTPSALAYNRVVRAVVRSSVNLRMRPLRAFRRTVGLPSSREDVFLDFGRPNKGNAVFGLFSPRFAPAAPDQPPNLRVTGFPFYAAADAERYDLEPSLRAFLDAGAPPIVFTLGSFAPEVSGNFYDRSLHAARMLGHRAVLLAGRRDAARLAALVGPNEHACAQAPDSLLFPRCLCIVHHGGIGTTAEALRAGKPQLVVPFFGDQPDHGARVERLGVGLSLRLSAFDERRAAATLRALVGGDYADEAMRFAASISGEQGVAAIADWTRAVTRRVGTK